LNIEARLRSRDLLGIKGLDPKRFTIIESQKGNLLTGEKYLAIAEHLIKSHPGCVIILDSAGAICTNAELTAGMEEMQRADGPKLLAKFCRKISNLLPVQDVIFICILQLQANPSGYGASMVEKSGNAIRYITDTKLKIKKFSFVKSGDKPIGQELHWICECSPLCGPGNEITGFVRYGTGLDKKYEVMNIGLDCGILVQKGAWIISPFLDKLSENKKEFTIQGKEKMYQFLLKNPEAYMLLETKIKEMLSP